MSLLRNIGLTVVLLLATFFSTATTLKQVNVANGSNRATATLSFSERPVYDFFPLRNPDRLVLDVRHSSLIQGLPLTFSGENILKRIRTSTPKDSQSIRLVFELTQAVKTQAVIQKNGGSYNLILTLNGSDASAGSSTRPVVALSAPSQPVQNPFKPTTVTGARSGTPASRISDALIVAIDAGHGGQDPGAMGPGGLKEKNVTIAIARKLKALLNADPLFRGVMTRDGDYFISVMGRSDVARKQNANLLVSIHADAAPNRSASGASVWVLSNRRANSEMANWLEQHEKQSELLGGAGDLLANSQADPYLSQAVLDLQFGHSQRVGYDVAVKVIAQLQRVGALHKRRPEHASLGVLRSPDIPSLLVETGFISNPAEERLLGSSAYQEKIAGSIYKGLRSYFLAHPLQSAPKAENRPLMPATTASVVPNPAPARTQYTGATQRHIVARGETLSGIASKYGISMATLRTMNALKRDLVWVGQRLNVPANGAPVVKPIKAARHKVVRGDSLTAIAARYGVSAKAIQEANNMKTQNVMLGQTLKIPAS